MNGTAYPGVVSVGGISFRSVRNRDVSPAAPMDGFTAVRNETPPAGTAPSDAIHRS